MSPWLTPNSCIAASRITIDCLRILGIPAEPVATKFMVQVEEIGMAYACGLSAEELYTAGESIRHPRWIGWDGHLVVRAGEWLIDPSFHQADIALGKRLRVEGIPMFPFPVGTNSLEFHASYTGRFDSGLTAQIDYVAIQDNSWRDSGAWNDEGLVLLTRRIASQVISENVT